MGRRNRGGFNDFFGGFRNCFGRGFLGNGFFRGCRLNGWFTPIRCCVYGAIFCSLIFFGVGFTGMVIIALLLLILQLIC
ncbi:MAG: hypothetical protein RR628_01765 [Clostridium sp.]|uniref:hypothetical protein n=1 Tax=Clostridium sp. TaxID=1506 RepID=UPI002FC6702C